MNTKVFLLALAVVCVSIIAVQSKNTTPCICQQIYDPVCGADGKTYSSACDAVCANVGVASNEACPCICPLINAPVCGTDGKTYPSPCDAGCAGYGVARTGNCSD